MLLEQVTEEPAEEPESPSIDYKLDQIVITFDASYKIPLNKEISYLKYRVQYAEKKDFDGKFDCKSP